MKVIKLLEEQFNRIFEGIEYSYNGLKNNEGLPVVNFRVNHNLTDAGNVEADTRLFGKAKDILNGDGTVIYTKLSKSFKDRYERQMAYINLLKKIINITATRPFTENDIDNQTLLDTKSLRVLQSKAATMNPTEQHNWAVNTLNRLSGEFNVRSGLYNRAINANPNDKIARYNVGLVPETDVKVIALFNMKDFNMSDAIKNGKLRQGPLTDTLLNIDKNQRFTSPTVYGTGKSFAKIPISYDNGITPDIQSNFSLKNVESGHYRSTNQPNNSVQGFIDKSILGAAYAIKEQKFNADCIVAAPSSSSFNDYYCKRLSDKLGIPFYKGFFKRNVINVVVSPQDERRMAEMGWTEESISSFKEKVKKMVMEEIGYEIAEPIKEFCEKYSQLLDNTIRYKKSSRNKLNDYAIEDFIVRYAFDSMYEFIKNSNMVGEYNLNIDEVLKIYSFVDNNYESFKIKKNYNDSKKDADYVGQTFFNLLNRNEQMNEDFRQYLFEMAYRICECTAKFIQEGYSADDVKPSLKKAKLVEFSKNERVFLNNVYVIADEKMLRNYNKAMNMKFILFDEDMNSGATLRLLIDALKERNVKDNNILCLVNAYSSGGR